MFDFILFWNIFSENVHLIKQKIIQNQLIVIINYIYVYNQ